MYGLIGKIRTVDGQRDAFIQILSEGTKAMPGCLSYVIAQDTNDPDVVWICEVWESAESHQASLSLLAVQQAIARGRSLIAGFEQRVETTPISGWNLTGNDWL